MYYSAMQVEPGPQQILDGYLGKTDHLFLYKHRSVFNLDELADKAQIIPEKDQVFYGDIELVACKNKFPLGGNYVLFFMDVICDENVKPAELMNDFNRLRDTKAFVPWKEKLVWGWIDIDPEAGWGPRVSRCVQAKTERAWFGIFSTEFGYWFLEGERLLKLLVPWLEESKI